MAKPDITITSHRNQLGPDMAYLQNSWLLLFYAVWCLFINEFLTTKYNVSRKITIMIIIIISSSSSSSGSGGGGGSSSSSSSSWKWSHTTC
jgi:hypothetical protein